MTELMGQVAGGKENPYWQRLAKGMKTSRWGEWFCRKVTPVIMPFVIAVTRIGLLPFSQKPEPKLVEFSDHFIDHYAPSLYPTMAKTLELEAYKNWLPEEPSLEIGIGDGFFTSLLLEDRKLTIAGDLIYKTLLSAKDYPIVKSAALMDAQAIPLPENCLQSYMMNNLMHHLPDRLGALDEAHRVMMPDGVFVFTDNLSGWVESIWHISLAGKLGLKSLKKRLIDSKLENSAQVLLPNEQWWREQIDPEKWEIMEYRSFYSNPAYTLTSLYESLTYKQGGLVPPPILQRILRFPGAKMLFKRLLPPIVHTLLARDKEWSQSYGATFQFVVLKKKAQAVNEVNDVYWCCPVTQEKLRREDDELVGTNCRYPVLKEVPLLVPQWEEIESLQEHIEQVDRDGYLRYQT